MLSEFKSTKSIALDEFCLPYSKQNGLRIAPTVLAINHETIKAVVARLQTINPSTIILEGVSLLQLLAPLRNAFPSAKLIVDFHNVESQLLQENDKARIHKHLRFAAHYFCRRDWHNAHKADLIAGEMADAIWACSQEDAQTALAMGITCPIHVIPNPVPNWCRPLPPPMLSKAPKLLFIGHLGYPPNKTAVRFLTKDILPQLRAINPSSELIVAGRSPNRKIQTLIAKTEGAELIASPDDLLPLYEHSSAAIIPLFEGGGTRIKVLEALAIGRPIIATEKAVENLGLLNGKHYLSAQTTSEFVQKILTIHTNPELAICMREAGFDFIHTHFSATKFKNAIQCALT